MLPRSGPAPDLDGSNELLFWKVYQSPLKRYFLFFYSGMKIIVERSQLQVLGPARDHWGNSHFKNHPEQDPLSFWSYVKFSIVQWSLCPLVKFSEFHGNLRMLQAVLSEMTWQNSTIPLFIKHTHIYILFIKIL